MLNDNERVEEFERYIIKTRRICDEQFIKNDFDKGFGWTFQMFTIDSQTLIFSVVVKSLNGERDNINVQKACELGLNIVHQRIRERKFDEMKNYCYRWEPNFMPITEVDCQTIDSLRFDLSNG